jgi:hypothetical protein
VLLPGCVDLADYRRMAAAIREADKVLRAVAVPVGQAVIEEGSEGMPRHGGLAAWFADGPRVTVSSARQGVTMTLLNRHGSHLGSYETGSLRHPVFGRFSMTTRAANAAARDAGLKGKALKKVAQKYRRSGWTWAAQRVPEGLYGDAFAKQAETVSAALGDVARSVLSRLES